MRRRARERRLCRPPWPPETVALIEELAGKITAERIAARIGVPLSNLQAWCSRRGISLRRAPSRLNRMVIGRLRAEARRQGLRMHSRGGRIVLLMEVTDPGGVTVEEAERLLAKKRAGDERREQHATSKHLRNLRGRLTVLEDGQDRSAVTLPTLRFMQDESEDARGR